MLTRLIAAALLFLALLTAAQATTYYISTTGSDGADGSFATPWASPNHAVNSGDIINVKAGSYTTGWATGTVTGSTQAKLYCLVFFSCVMNSNSTEGFVRVYTSHWDVEGFQATNTTTNGACITISPSGATTITDIKIKNNNLYGCVGGNGINPHDNGLGGSFDYLTIESNIIYNSAGSFSGFCNSGISVFSPRNSDFAPGIHITVRGNFAYANINSNHSGTTYCSGVNQTTDGEGITIDTPGSLGNSFKGLILVEDNITVGNGGPGINCTWCDTGQVIYRNNTIWKNTQDPNLFPIKWGGFAVLQTGKFLQVYNNLVQSITTTCCSGGQLLYAAVDSNNAGSTPAGVTNIYDYNVLTGSGGQNGSQYNGSFTYSSTNAMGTDPTFAAPTIPGQLDCTPYADVPACLVGTGVIAAFTPTNAAVHNTGYSFFCAQADILGSGWGNQCDVGAISW